MVIDENGYVGIGTTSPEASLHVFAQDGTKGIMIEGNGAATGGSSQKRASMRFRYGGDLTADGTSAEAMLFQDIGDSDGDRPTGFRFYSNLGSNGIGEIMYMEGATGEVGIGTTDPKSKLQVNGGDITVRSVGSGVILRSPDASCWRVTVDNSGNMVTTSITCP